MPPSHQVAQGLSQVEKSLCSALASIAENAGAPLVGAFDDA